MSGQSPSETSPNTPTYQTGSTRAARPSSSLSWETKRQNIQARLSAKRKCAAKAKDETERIPLEDETRKLAADLADHRVPRVPRLVANDVTEESLGTLLMQNDGRIFVASDEGGPFR